MALGSDSAFPMTDSEHPQPVASLARGRSDSASTLRARVMLRLLRSLRYDGRNVEGQQRATIPPKPLGRRIRRPDGSEILTAPKPRSCFSPASLILLRASRSCHWKRKMRMSLPRSAARKAQNTPNPSLETHCYRSNYLIVRKYGTV